MNDIIRYVLRSAVCLALFYSVYALLLRRETYFTLNRIVLFTTMVLSLILPLHPFPSPWMRHGVSAGFPLSETAGVSAPGWNLWDGIWILYLAGTGFFIFRFLVSLARLGLLVHRYGIVKEGESRFVFTQEKISEFAFFNLVFINREELNEKEFRQIVAHEKIHIIQWHSVDMLLSEAFIILQWFNPFVWLYKGSIKEIHEFIADGAVIAQGCDSKAYQRLILERFVGARLFGMASNFNESQMKRRITMMKKSQSTRWAFVKLFAIIPVLVLLVLVLARPKSTTARSVSMPGVMQPVLFSETDAFMVQDTHDIDKKKEEDLKKKISILKSKYAELDKKKAEGGNVEEMEAEQKKIKEKISEIKAELNAIGTPSPGVKQGEKELKEKEKQEALKKKELEQKAQAVQDPNEVLQANAQNEKQLKEKQLKEEQLKKKQLEEQQLKEKEWEVQKLKKQQQEQELQALEKESEQIVVQKQELELKEKELQAKKMELKQTEQGLEQNELELKKKELEQKESEQKEQELKQKEWELKEQELRGAEPEPGVDIGGKDPKTTDLKKKEHAEQEMKAQELQQKMLKEKETQHP